MGEEHAEGDFVLRRGVLEAAVWLDGEDLLAGELGEVRVDWIVEDEGAVLDELEGANGG